MNALKPAAIALAAIALAAGAGWALLSAVTGEGAPRYVCVNEAPSATGDAEMPFEYRLSAVDENGARSEVVFDTSKELREGAFLETRVLPVRGVISWAEVARDDMPVPAARALGAL